MSSTTHQDSTFAPFPGSKRRRLQGACDTCRHKKIKCDSALMPGNRCSNCIAFDSDCTHNLLKKGPGNSVPSASKSQSYVTSLEERVKSLERTIQELRRESDLVKDSGNAVLHEEPPAEGVLMLGGECLPRPVFDKTTSASPQTQGSDNVDVEELADQLKQLHILPAARFFGKSSSFALLNIAMGVKQEYTNLTSDNKPDISGVANAQDVTGTVTPATTGYEFPEPSLLNSLVETYFGVINLTVPLLHRPTFESQLAANLHLRDHWFGSGVLAICAIASRHSDDPRVIHEEGGDPSHSTGEKWFSQIPTVRQSFTLSEAPSLYELQFYSLAILYYQGTSNPQACWLMAGIGMRYAQEVGAHRRTSKVDKPTLQDELWKRAFWALMFTDRLLSAYVGRPCTLHAEDYDVEYPVEVDDEYWTNPNPELAFKQPPGKLSNITAFNLLLKLGEILGIALRLLYSANKSKLWTGLPGIGVNLERRIVVELDSQLNEWLDSVPEMLRWKPQSDDPDLYSLSAHLFCTYYYIQILVHRPFISAKASSLSFPSLSICVNAARSCAHLLDSYMSFGFGLPAPTCQIVAFTSSIILLINIWGAKKSRISFNTDKEMADVHKLMYVLKVYETRWRVSGRLWDKINALTNMDQSPIPDSNTRSNKRPQPAQRVSDMTSVDDGGIFTIADLLGSPTPTLSSAGSSYIDVPTPLLGTPQPHSHAHSNVFSSDELARLPVFNSITFPQWPTSEITIDRAHSSSVGHGELHSYASHLNPQSQSQQVYRDEYSLTIPVAGYPTLTLPPDETPDLQALRQAPRSVSTTMSDRLHQNQDKVAPEAFNMFDNNTGGGDLWASVAGGFDLDVWSGYLASFDANPFA